MFVSRKKWNELVGVVNKTAECHDNLVKEFREKVEEVESALFPSYMLDWGNLFGTGKKRRETNFDRTDAHVQQALKEIDVIKKYLKIQTVTDPEKTVAKKVVAKKGRR